MSYSADSPSNPRSCHVRSFTMNAGGGLFYEAAAQLTFPMDEVISASFITLVFNAVGAVYTLLGSSISAAAMNWILAGVCAYVYCFCGCFCCTHVHVGVFDVFFQCRIDHRLFDACQAALVYVRLACLRSKKTIVG